MAFILSLAFIFGSAVGSFLNVVIDRVVVGQSIMGRSRCDHCRAKLSSLDLIPIVSFITLGARCRYCRKPLSAQYPLVEAATAVLFVLSTLFLARAGNLNFISLSYYLLVCAILIIVAVVDIKFSLIPTSFVYFGSLVALVYNFLFLTQGEFINGIVAAFAAAVFFGFIVLVTLRRGMGEGDVVLGFFIGMVLGVARTSLAVFLAFFLGAVVSLALIFFGKKKFGQTVPFAPFLVLGMLIAMFWGEQIVGWYLRLYR